MRNVEETIYKYSELSKEVQQKVFQKYQLSEQEFYQYDEIQDQIREQLELLGFEVEHIYIDNSYSQGSGGCFTGWFRPEDVKSKEFFGEEYDLSTYVDKYRITHNYRYHHEYSTQIELFDLDDEVDRDLGDLEPGFKLDYQYICQRLFRVAQKDYENTTSDEVVLEILGEKEFYENGMEYHY